MDKTKEKIIRAYIDYLAREKNAPKSIHHFMQSIKLKEGTFYKYFASFEKLEGHFWKEIFSETISGIEQEEVYADYTSGEKLLALYFAWIERLKEYREFIRQLFEQAWFYEVYPNSFSAFKSDFDDFIEGVVHEGIANGEIADRRFLTDNYKYLLWLQPVTIIKFWLKDESDNFEDTDALIEKTIHFAFDLMQPNGLDSFVDLAKFHIQHF